MGRFLGGRRVVVVGAGVVGLSSAVVLMRAGYEVRVVAEHGPFETVSAQAGAIWNPHMVEHPDAPLWWRTSRDELLALRGEPKSGVSLVDGSEVFASQQPIPLRIQDASNVRPIAREELPPGFVVGWNYACPMIDMPMYLAYLLRRLEESGVEIHTGIRIQSLGQAISRDEILINCTGLGARDLTPDAEVVPSRGQMLVVENPGVRRFFIDGDGSTCIFPHSRTVLLGGSSEFDRTDPRPDPALDESIRAACSGVEPKLATARTLGHRVGLRPLRPTVRVELDAELPGVVHNYGHGGAGVTLSWGCATEVLRIVREM